MRVLFVGNSYTHANDLPGMLQDLACAAGNSLETASVTSGGKTLEWHWYNPETREAIDEGDWDFVVLQEHSQRPVEEPEKTLHAAIRLGARIRKVGATPMFYLTWARQHIPEMQDALIETYTRAAREIDAEVAPVGSAWRGALTASPELVLHTADRSHPNVLGTYLTACVFYATLFGETPVGLPNEFACGESVKMVIEEEMAATLQQAAWTAVKEFGKGGED
jgi:Domain of unknown function (DUF4886)